MEKWKLGVIMVVLGGLIGFGAWTQTQKSATSTNIPSPTAPDTFQAGDISLMVHPSIQPLLNQPAKPWNIPQKFWMNTPRALDVKDFKGQVTLVEFFRIFCPHCRDASPFMDDLYKAYSPRGLKMVSIHSPGYRDEEKDWTYVQAVVKKIFETPYPVAFDQDSKVFKAYGGQLFPTTLLLDKNGVVVFGTTGFTDAKGEQIKAAIEKQLAAK